MPRPVAGRKVVQVELTTEEWKRLKHQAVDADLSLKRYVRLLLADALQDGGMKCRGKYASRAGGDTTSSGATQARR